MFTADRNFYKRPFWALSVDEVFELLALSKQGLSEDEAKERLREVGGNTLPKKKRGARFKIFVSQFKSPLILILVAAGGVTLAVQDFKDAAFIFAAVLINVALGFYQENKAESALSKLETYIKERVRVIRVGREREISADEVVPGDILKLSAGTRVPADARLIAVNDMSTDESILTGESVPEKKETKPAAMNAVVADQASMVFSGTLVTEGVGLAVAVRTGANTELGRIAALVGEKESDRTPLQIAITKFSLWAGGVLFVFTILLFAVGIYLGYSVFDMFLISVAVAVSIVPEGLPIALTVALAVGVERLARRKGVVRKLVAAEALGSTTLVLTDKTGTLTEAKMELKEIIGEKQHGEILRLAMLASDVVIENPEDEPENWRLIGRALETSVVRAGIEHKVFLPELDHEVLERKPFNSTDKFSASRVKFGGRERWIKLGAPDVLLKNAKLDKKQKEALLYQIDDLAYGGYRVLGIEVDSEFWGLLAFHDPVRPTVGKAIRDVGLAGVRTVIVTGDHKGTALSVANEIGLKVKRDDVITGEELEGIDDEKLKEMIPRIRIFARVTPTDKLRITDLYQELGEVVAVTGDGVNDAPALKGADIGVAVGSGTDVAKEAADLVILDDNFETIVAAISEGRRILENIRKSIVYLLSSALDELLLIGGAIVMGLPLPLNALQILWVNFFSDSFPAVALAFEDERDVLAKRRSKKKQLIDSEMKFLIAVIGTATSALLFVLYAVLLKLGYPEDIVRTFIFAGFAAYTLFLVFSMKSLHESIFRSHPFDNPYLIAGALIGLSLAFGAVYVPMLQKVLGTVSLPFPWVIGVIGIGIVNIAAVELGKLFFRRGYVR